MAKKTKLQPTKTITIMEKGQRREVPMDGPILPVVPKIQDATDPYAPSAHVQSVDRYTADPLSRTQALSAKVSLVTAFLAILTGCLMVMMSWFPKDWPELLIFLLWVALASVEWIAVFVFLAYLDHKETPAALNWFLARNYVKMMHREQKHRLQAMYPDQFLEEDDE